MSKGREISDYLDDIVTAIADAGEFTHGMSYEMFAADKKTVNAVIRCLEVLGEAAKHIPTSFRKKHPDIPWSKMAGMRDVLIHDYMGVDLKTVWKVAQERLPELKPLLEGLKPAKND
ncbi:MAG: DUF86 domain-containing protein [Desulfovibrionales bacterium]|nr:DUF86 domain-containing protein [Desulfovibrionales bacterium]